MKILLKEIPRAGKVYETKYEAQKLDLNTPNLWHVGPIHATIKVNVRKNKLLVKIIYTCVIEFRCVRCLKKTNTELKNEISLEYKIKSEQEFLDFTDDVRQEIILNYPKKLLCKGDCKGLCMICGKNLNVGDCGCKRAKYFSPFSKLSK